MEVGNSPLTLQNGRRHTRREINPAKKSPDNVHCLYARLHAVVRHVMGTAAAARRRGVVQALDQSFCPSESPSPLASAVDAQHERLTRRALRGSIPSLVPHIAFAPANASADA